MSGRYTHATSKESNLANWLYRTPLIQCDEAPMSHQWVLIAIDRSLRGAPDINETFSGTTMLFPGDFRKILPAFRCALDGQIAAAGMKPSLLWAQFNTIKLRRKSRVCGFLLMVGNWPYYYGLPKVQTQSFPLKIDFLTVIMYVAEQYQDEAYFSYPRYHYIDDNWSDSMWPRKWIEKGINTTFYQQELVNDINSTHTHKLRHGTPIPFNRNRKYRLKLHKPAKYSRTVSMRWSSLKLARVSRGNLLSTCYKTFS